MNNGRKMNDSLGKKLVSEVTDFRETLSERVKRVNSLTETEVIGAADAVGAIVDMVATLSSQTKETLEGISFSDHGDDEKSLAVSIAKQSDTTELFVSVLQGRMEKQRSVAAQAYEQSQAISEAANSVERLSRQATMLAINAMIEAARMGEAGASFTVIGNEMQWLSKEIKRTNTLVAGLAENLGELLPSIAKMIEETSSHTDAFSGTIKETISEVRERTTSLQGGVEELLTDNEDAMSTILNQSNAALSHLQFQDTVAQGLMRLDCIVRDLIISVGTLGGEDMSNMLVPEEEHVEIGGEKLISPDEAGEVMLF